LFTIKTTQKLLKTSGDQAQELIESQVMGQAVLEGHLMVPAQDQRELQAMALEQTVVIPAMVLLMAPEAQATALVMVPQVVTETMLLVVVQVVTQAVRAMVAPQVQAMAPEMEAMVEAALTVA
jgi:hypothetical protein